MVVCVFALLLTSIARADSFLIVPGRSLGRTHLGRKGTSYLRKLPTATASDASMMQNNLVWVSPYFPGRRPDTLYIHTVSNSVLDPPKPGVTISEIRVTSGRFHTHDGISPGSTLAQIRRRFPQGHLLAGAGNSRRNFYVVGGQGIAFEFARRPDASGHCIAITVYPPGAGNGFATDDEVGDILRSGSQP